MVIEAIRVYEDRIKLRSPGLRIPGVALRIPGVTLYVNLLRVSAFLD